jgi:hypothetical protein
MLITTFCIILLDVGVIALAMSIYLVSRKISRIWSLAKFWGSATLCEKCHVLVLRDAMDAHIYWHEHLRQAVEEAEFLE